MPSPLPVDRVEYRRLLWRSLVGTAVLAVPLVLGVTQIVTLVASDDGDTRPAAFVFLFLSLYTIAAVWWAVRLWRRSFAARPVVLAVDATYAEQVGVPGLDDPAPARHRSLSGEQELPPRW